MIMEFTRNLLSKYTLEYITDRYVAIDTITITINKISVKKHCYNSFKVMKERLEQDQFNSGHMPALALALASGLPPGPDYNEKSAKKWVHLCSLFLEDFPCLANVLCQFLFRAEFL